MAILKKASLGAIVGGLLSNKGEAGAGALYGFHKDLGMSAGGALGALAGQGIGSLVGGEGAKNIGTGVGLGIGALGVGSCHKRLLRI